MGKREGENGWGGEAMGEKGTWSGWGRSSLASESNTEHGVGKGSTPGRQLQNTCTA